MSNTGKTYTEEFRRDAVELLRSSGRPLKQVARELGVNVNSLRARWWTNSPQSDVMIVQDRVIEAIEAALTKNAIDMPYPTQVHLFHDQTEESDGIRSEQREGWPSDGKDPKTARIVDSLREENGNTDRSDES